jgi:hypothetical protein
MTIYPHGVIATATDDDVARFYGPIEFTSRYVAKALRKGKLVAALGGAFEHKDGVWYGFLEIPVSERRLSVYRHTVRLLQEVKAAGAVMVRATCQTEIPRAAEFLARLGFVPTEDEIDGRQVWEWRF